MPLTPQHFVSQWKRAGLACANRECGIYVEPAEQVYIMAIIENVVLLIKLIFNLRPYNVLRNSVIVEMNTKTPAQITVKYERTVEDIIEFNLFHRANSPGLRRRELVTEVVVALLVFIGALTAGYMLNFDKRAITGFSFVLALLLSFLPFIIFPYVDRADLIQQLRKLTKEGDNKSILGPQTISLTPDNIVVKAQSLESKCMWDSIDKIAQNDKYIFVYISSINALVIPRKAFSRDSSLQEFLNYLNLHREKKNTNITDSE